VGHRRTDILTSDDANDGGSITQQADPRSMTQATMHESKRSDQELTFVQKLEQRKANRLRQEGKGSERASEHLLDD
jgi:hypothetical protein